jgi:hypothetical protein
MLHVCVGNVSKVVRSVGVGGSCIAAPTLVAETPLHWALNATPLADRVAALEGLVSTLQAQVAALQAGLSSEAAARGVADASLQAQVNTIGGTTVPQVLLDLANYVSVETGTINDLAGPHVIFTGANVHVRNGLGATNGDPDSSPTSNPVTNGVGNLVVGYNEQWTFASRSGSHNLVVGSSHGYSSVGGVVFGRDNAIGGPFASVSGGTGNAATGLYASVTGGSSNLASGVGASVSGGQFNTASGFNSSVSGGSIQTASAANSHVP